MRRNAVAVLAVVACHSPPAASIADDPSRTSDERCADAFATFRTRIHPGDTAASVRAVLGTPTWIGSDEPIDVLGGEIPIEMTQADQTLVFKCLPKAGAQWAIYARIEGRDHKTFGAFLSSGGAKKLIEYALVHVESDGQHMKIEKFPR